MLIATWHALQHPAPATGAAQPPRPARSTPQEYWNLQDGARPPLSEAEQAELEPFLAFLAQHTGASVAQLLRMLRLAENNDFVVWDSALDPLCQGVYPLGALLNHDCWPNCVLLYDQSGWIQVTLFPHARRPELALRGPPPPSV
jgi:hypothetical protein